MGTVINAKLGWTGKMHFNGKVGSHEVQLDSKPPLGTDLGFTPKELVALGIGGCTAMDVVALMKKYKQEMESFEVLVTTEANDTHPIRFKSVQLLFQARGSIDPEKIIEAVRLSQTKYCGVSAMIAATCPLNYKIEVNGDVVSEGRANFEITPL